MHATQSSFAPGPHIPFADATRDGSLPDAVVGAGDDARSGPVARRADLLLSETPLPPHPAGGISLMDGKPWQERRALLVALLHDAATTAPTRPAVAAAFGAALTEDGQRLPSEAFALARVHLTDLCAVRRRDADGVRAIDAALEHRAEDLRAHGDARRGLIGAAYDALQAIAAAPALAVELKANAHGGRAWLRPLDGGTPFLADLRGCRARLQGDIVVGFLLPFDPCDDAERRPALPGFAPSPLTFGVAYRAAVAAILAAEGASARDADAALPALLAFAVRRALAEEAAEIAREYEDLPPGGELFDVAPCLGLYRCEDPETWMAAALDADLIEDFDDHSAALVLADRVAPFDSIRADLTLDDGELWIRTLDEPSLEAVVAALQSASGGSLRRLTVRPAAEA